MKNVKVYLLLLTLFFMAASFLWLGDDPKHNHEVDITPTGFDNSYDLSINFNDPFNPNDSDIPGKFGDVALAGAQFGNNGMIVVGKRYKDCLLDSENSVGIITLIRGDGTYKTLHSGFFMSGVTNNVRNETIDDDDPSQHLDPHANVDCFALAPADISAEACICDCYCHYLDSHPCRVSARDYYSFNDIKKIDGSTNRYVVTGSALGGKAGVFIFSVTNAGNFVLEASNSNISAHYSTNTPPQVIDNKPSSGGGIGINQTCDGGFIVSCTSNPETYIVKLHSDLSTQWISKTLNNMTYSKMVVECPINFNDGNSNIEMGYAVVGENQEGQGTYLAIFKSPGNASFYPNEISTYDDPATAGIEGEIVYHSDLPGNSQYVTTSGMGVNNLPKLTKSKSIAISADGTQLGIGGINTDNSAVESFSLITLDLLPTTDLSNVQYDLYLDPNNNTESNYAQSIIGHSTGGWVLGGRSHVNGVTEMALVYIDPASNTVLYEYFNAPHADNNNQNNEPGRWADVAHGIVELDDGSIGIFGSANTEICYNCGDCSGSSATLGDLNPANCSGTNVDCINNPNATGCVNVFFECSFTCGLSSECRQGVTDFSPSTDTYVATHNFNLGTGTLSSICNPQGPTNCNNTTISNQITRTSNPTALHEVACLQANPTGGTPPYTYAWTSNSNASSNPEICDPIEEIYTVTISDANGCTLVDTIDLRCMGEYRDVNISTTVGMQNSEQCIWPNVSGTNNTPLFYIWTRDNNHVVTLYAQNTYFLNGMLCKLPTGNSLPNGNYCVTVIDSKGKCGQSCKTITNAGSGCVDPTVSIGSFSNGSEACLEATPSGGTPPYTFTWESDNYDNTGSQVCNPIGELYCVTVTDANLCSGETCFDLSCQGGHENINISASQGTRNGNVCVWPNVSGNPDPSLPLIYIWTLDGNHIVSKSASSTYFTGGLLCSLPDGTPLPNGEYCVTVIDDDEECGQDCVTVSGQSGNSGSFISPGPHPGLTPREASKGRGRSDNSTESERSLTNNHQHVIRIFPNPTNGEVTILLPPADAKQMAMYNIFGQRLLQLDQVTTDKLEIDLTNFATGIYIIQLNINGQIISKRIELVK